MGTIVTLLPLFVYLLFEMGIACLASRKRPNNYLDRKIAAAWDEYEQEQREKQFRATAQSVDNKGQ